VQTLLRRSVFLASLSLGCSPANVGGPADAGSATTSADTSSAVEQACEAAAYARCTRLETCSTPALELRFGDIRTCESTFRQVCINTFTAPSTGATLASSAACTAAIPNWACSDYVYNQNIPPPCQSTIGPRSNGSVCSVNPQCQTGFCALPVNGACGTCEASPPAGASCAQRVCPQTLTCTSGTLTCTPFVQVGGMCSANEPCNEGLACVASGPAASGVCEQGVQTQGGACAFLGAGCDFYSGLVCNAQSSTCQTAAFAGPGEACGVVANQSTPCIAGTCLRGACVANIAVGGACDIAGGPPCLQNARCIVASDGGTTGICQLNGATNCP
jgi:hypothetical protein